jgi:hypothetical protein
MSYDPASCCLPLLALHCTPSFLALHFPPCPQVSPWRGKMSRRTTGEGEHFFARPSFPVKPTRYTIHIPLSVSKQCMSSKVLMQSDRQRWRVVLFEVANFSGVAASFFSICPLKDGPNLKCPFLSFKGRDLSFSFPFTPILQSKLCFLIHFLWLRKNNLTNLTRYKSNLGAQNYDFFWSETFGFFYNYFASNFWSISWSLRSVQMWTNIGEEKIDGCSFHLWKSD